MQVDICSLASIKYDYIGYFEHMAEDVKTVVDRFGGQHIDIFNFGINAHFTNTDKKLAKLYDKVGRPSGFVWTCLAWHGVILLPPADVSRTVGHLGALPVCCPGKMINFCFFLVKRVQETYELVKKLYSMDFYISLNNITHQVPSALRDRFESEL